MIRFGQPSYGEWIRFFYNVEGNQLVTRGAVEGVVVVPILQDVPAFGTRRAREFVLPFHNTFLLAVGRPHKARRPDPAILWRDFGYLRGRLLFAFGDEAFQGIQLVAHLGILAIAGRASEHGEGHPEHCQGRARVRHRGKLETPESTCRSRGCAVMFH